VRLGIILSLFALFFIISVPSVFALESEDISVDLTISSPTNYAPLAKALLGFIIIILLIIAIVVVILLKRSSNKRKKMDDGKYPRELSKTDSNNMKNMEIIKERLAKGEITKQEYVALKKEFEDGDL
jgi:uncharacterized membrane protein